MASFGGGHTPRIAGLVTWLAAGVPLLLIAPPRTEESVVPQIAVLASYLAFGAAFLAMTRIQGEPRCTAPRLTLLGIQSASALAMGAALHTGFEGIFLVIVAAQLVFAMPVRGAIAWAAAQSVAFTLLQIPRMGLVSALVQLTAYLGFQAFAIYSGWVAERESRQREELSRLNAELKSTQELLAESSRLAERTRIARDLHDVLGHHLTALSLSLEVASHVADGKAREEVERARSLAKLLLADVRGVVSQFRENEALDLTRSLRVLAAGIPRPEIALDVAADVHVTDPAAAEALLRCAQELVTNAAKHSGARRLTLALARRDGALVLTAADDGHGAARLVEGHGLTGMRERLAELGGALRVTTGAGTGFFAEVALPSPERAP